MSTGSDVVVHDATVLAMDGRDEIYRDGTVVVEDGEIADVRESKPSDPAISAETVIDGSDSLVMPGLVNAHAHLEISALIGAFSEMGLGEMFADMTALCEQLGRGEYEYLVEASVELAALNFVRGGVTTVNAMDAIPRHGAESFGEAGLRGFFGPWISDLFWDIPEDEQFERARSFIEEYHDTYDGRIRATVCPHDDWSCSREVWERVADLAAEYPELPVHTHLLELEEGNVMSRANDAADSLALLDDVGLLDDRLVAAHFRVADEADVEKSHRLSDVLVSVPEYRESVRPRRPGRLPGPGLWLVRGHGPTHYRSARHKIVWGDRSSRDRRARRYPGQPVHPSPIERSVPASIPST